MILNSGLLFGHPVYGVECIHEWREKFIAYISIVRGIVPKHTVFTKLQAHLRANNCRNRSITARVRISITAATVESHMTSFWGCCCCWIVKYYAVSLIAQRDTHDWTRIAGKPKCNKQFIDKDAHRPIPYFQLFIPLKSCNAYHSQWKCI